MHLYRTGGLPVCFHVARIELRSCRAPCNQSGRQGGFPMSLWLFERLRQKRQWLKRHRKCERCGGYYRKELQACSLCSDLTDARLQEIIGKRRAFRMTLGKGMMIGAALILFLMVALASL